MNEQKTPGVYISERNTLPTSVLGVDSAIPVFIGKTQKVPLNHTGDPRYNEPIRVTSLADYENLFGTADPEAFTITVPGDGNLEGVNIVRDGSELALYYQMQLFFANGGSTCYVFAIKEYTNFTQSDLNSLASKDDITLVVLSDVAANDNDNYTTVCSQMLTHCQEFNRFLLIDFDTPEDDVKVEAFRNKISNNSDELPFAAVYTPFVNTTIGYQISDRSITIKMVGGDGDPLDTYKDDHSELYNQALALATRQRVNQCPPSAAMAGIYAKVDKQRGIWMAPANFSLAAVTAPVVAISAKDQESLNVDVTSGKSINAIRTFQGVGTLIWGARTLDGNSNEWRYISVRRLFSYVETSVKNALQRYVFAANNENTWLQVSTMIKGFLEKLWLQGAFAGGTADDAFFVNLGLGETMTAEDILNGRMIIHMGLAATRPAEFIILEVTQLLPS